MSPHPTFQTLTEALDWLYTIVDDPYIDNIRYAPTNNKEEMIRYNQSKDSGCCGSFDMNIIVNNTQYVIGCNYGH